MNWFEWREAPVGRFAVVGDPVSHSLSPAMHNAALRQIGEPGEYRAIRVPLDEFGQAMDWLTELGYEGLNVTVPLKGAAMQWCEAYGDDSDVIGAVNTILLADRIGWNTDWEGFRVLLEFAIRKTGRGLPKRLLLLGAGGAARVVLAVCTDIGVGVKVWNRNQKKAHQMVDLFGAEADVIDDPLAIGCEVVVDATSAGLTGDAPPVDWEGFDGVAIDLKYGKSARPFLDSAEAHGVIGFDGRIMLAAQGAASLNLWTGKPVPMDVMLTALDEH